MTQAQMTQAIMTAIAAALQNPKFPKPSKKAAKVKKQADKPDFEAALIAAAVKAGYASPEPRFNLLTYDKWIEKGRRVRKGEKSLRVLGKKSGIFHESQTEAEPQAAA